MKRLSILVGLALLILISLRTTLGASGDYQEFKSQAGRFSVETPVRLSPFTLVERTRDGTMAIHFFMRALGDRVYSVEYFDFSEAALDQHSPQELLDFARDDALARTKSKLVSEISIVLNGYPGLEIEMQGRLANGTKVTTRAHLFLVENRMYAIMVDAQTGRMSDDEMDDFIDSFKLLGR